MPELPEVETIAENLRQSALTGIVIEDLVIYWTKSIAHFSVEEYRRKIMGQMITHISRRGKNLILALSNDLFIIIHLRMSGRLILCEDWNPIRKHEHIILKMRNGKELRFHDTRKFGRWYLTDNLNLFFKNLGFEPLNDTFTLDAFTKELKKRSRALKPLLLDQSFIAGLGNIYVDEALWEAKVHPKTLSNQLSKGQIKKLFQSIINVLKKGIINRGTSLGSGKPNFYGLMGVQGSNQEGLNVFRLTGKPCPRCGNIIEKIIVAQRSTHFCPHCQNLG
jgi:formamidopyrimidine-DNA glycosylase